MAAQKLDLQIKGLYTSPNNLSAVPAGALSVANNIQIDAKSVVSSRRGQTQYGSPLPVAGSQVHKIFNYGSSLIANYGVDLAVNRIPLGTEWTTLPSDYSAPGFPTYKMRSLEAQGNFYFTSDRGVYKMDSAVATPRYAGVDRALGGDATLVGTGGFLLENTAVAYRMLWGYRDANNNLLLGAPSDRLIVRNPSGSGVDYNVELEFPIPQEITTEYFYQIYRSNAAATAADEPSEELQLVLEGNPTSGEVLARLFTVTDQTPYSLMRTTLYTSPSQQGIENANYPPPLAYDMTIFKNSAFYANTKQRESLTTTMISVGSTGIGYVTDATVDTVDTDATLTGITSTTNIRVGMRVVGTGIPDNTTVIEILSSTSVEMSQAATATGTVSLEFQDRLSLGIYDFWAGSAANSTTNTFLADTSGTPSENIEATSLSLVEIVNTGNSEVYGYYSSSTQDLPGQILFQAKTLFSGVGSFYATSTAPDAFSPALGGSVAILSVTPGDPITTVGTPVAHGLTTGDTVLFENVFTTPDISQNEYSVTVTSPTEFEIEVATTDGSPGGYFIKVAEAVVSEADEKQNRVYISKPNQPEAVPLYTYFDIGSANFPIQRAVALRDGVFFFKADGIYRLSGENFQNFTVSLLDNTVSLKAPESAVAFNNQVFCVTDQGVCAVTDSGVQIMSVPIEDELLRISSEQFTNFSTATFGVAYESSRQYQLWTVTDEDDEWATQAFIYNSLTDTWTRWDMERTCGVVNQSVNKLFMAEPDSGQVLIERKTYTNNDFADEQYAVTISSVVSSTVLELASITNVSTGMTIVQGSRAQLITGIDGTNVTVDSTSGFTAAAATVYTPIENELQWLPIDAENPGILKQFFDVVFFFRNAAFREIDVTFSSDISIGGETLAVESISSQGWGQSQWGQFPWGSPVGGNAVLRTYVLREKQRCHWLNIKLRTNEAFTGFSLQGLSLMYNPMTSRFK